MRTLRANTLKDYRDFFLHFGLAGAVSAGAFMALGTPPLLSLVAVGATAGIKFGLMPVIKKAFQEAIDEEKNADLKFDTIKPSARTTALARRILQMIEDPAKPESDRTSRIEGWIRGFAKTLGLKETPQLLVIPKSFSRKDLLKDSDDDTLKDKLRKSLTREFNKHANAFAFTHEKGNVVLSNPIVEVLNQKELKGVVAHEMGHLAAGHTKSRELMGWIAIPAKILTSLNQMLTGYGSLKNTLLTMGAGAVTDVATGVYKDLMHLDEEKPQDKANLARFKYFAGQTSLAGVAITFGAADMLAAQALSFATSNALNLIEKRYSRCNEFQADRIAAQITNDPESLCTGLEKVKAQHMAFLGEPKAEPMPKGILSDIFVHVKDMPKTHPDVSRRCERLRQSPVPSDDLIPPSQMMRFASSYAPAF